MYLKQQAWKGCIFNEVFAAILSVISLLNKSIQNFVTTQKWIEMLALSMSRHQQVLILKHVDTTEYVLKLWYYFMGKTFYRTSRGEY